MNSRHGLMVILVFIFLMSIGTVFFFNRNKDVQIIELGLDDSPIAWVYLCGLTRDWHDPLELENRNKLSCIGKQLGIKFIAIKPFHRCPQFDNKLCWPHDSVVETLRIYDQILNKLTGIKISGFIGFSNGGFFLNKLVQCNQLNVPVISIGSAGYLENGSYKNNLYLLIGKQDVYHIQGARQLYEQLKNSELCIQLIEYEDVHVIPEKLLETLIFSLIC